MPIAAVPDYLAKESLSDASPGLRFGMYLPLWGVNNRSKTTLWTTHDINYRVAGKDKEEREFKDDNKRPALGQAARLTATDQAVMQALAHRQIALADSLIASGQLLTLDGKSVAPFTTGLGNEHPLENGFAFLWPYGLPYLPGSGVKGVLRQAARELARGDWGETHGWTGDAIDTLFGNEDSDNARRGALSFWDVIPQIQGNRLLVEVMTAHQNHYYQQNDSPHESGKPNPINFLTVPPGSGFTFHVICNRPFLTRIAQGLAEQDRWKTLLTKAFEHAFDWLGFGAKTAVGYGQMEKDDEAIQQRDQDRQRRMADEEAARQEAHRLAALEALSPLERRIAELSERAETPRHRARLLSNALVNREFGDESVQAAERIRTIMQQDKTWKETSQKKKPEKDDEYQATLKVIKALN